MQISQIVIWIKLCMNSPHATRLMTTESTQIWYDTLDYAGTTLSGYGVSPELAS